MFTLLHIKCKDLDTAYDEKLKCKFLDVNQYGNRKILHDENLKSSLRSDNCASKSKSTIRNCRTRKRIYFEISF